MDRSFDLIVIGTGAGASPVATKCRKAGWSVAIIDALPFGGTCALRGCDPKKVLVGAAEAIEAARRLEGKGVAREHLRIRWPELMRFKRTFTEPVPDRREGALTKAGIVTLHGRARFVGPRSVCVGDETLEARYVHIATGAKPMDLRIAGPEHLATSDRFLEIDELPRRVVFLGSGYISFELAHVAAAAGAQVTMLEMLDRPLSGFDPDLVDLLAARTRAMGIDLQLETRVEAVERLGDAFVVRSIRRGQPVTFECDMVVHGAGRVPDLLDLGLHVAGVDFDPKRGVRVNEYMQSTSNPAVYAAGDAAAGGPPLTPVASFEGHVAASNVLEGNHRAIEYPPIPSVVFTLPPLASVGLRESEAKERDLRFRTNFERTSSWYSSRRVGEEFSAYKVLVEEGTGRILGAHVLGPNADEVINVFTVAMRAGMSATDLKKTIFAYPTHSSDLSYMV